MRGTDRDARRYRYLANKLPVPPCPYTRTT
jgi:hypothetical protein